MTYAFARYQPSRVLARHLADNWNLLVTSKGRHEGALRALRLLASKGLVTGWHPGLLQAHQQKSGVARAKRQRDVFSA